MGIRFYCRHCEKRLNVKARQAGEFCICPDCEKEIQIPLESTILLPKKKRKKKRRRKKSRDAEVMASVSTETLAPLTAESSSMSPVDVAVSVSAIAASVAPPSELAPVVGAAPLVEPPPVEDLPRSDGDVPLVEAAQPVEPPPTMVESELVDEPAPVVEDVAAVEEVAVVEEVPVVEDVPVVEHTATPSVEAAPPVESSPVESSPVEPEHFSSAEPEALDAAPEESFVEPMMAQGNDNLEEPSSEASFGDAQNLDSDAALDELLSDDERIPEDLAPESESFLLAKPIAKIGSDPLKSNPDLVWHLRHKRLGEKGPLKAREVEEMLENNQLRVGFIVWRQDWDDWIPVEKVFPQLAVEPVATPAYEIPAELNPHSEESRKRRARKWIWMGCSAAAFLLVIVLVYCLAQFS